MIELAGTYEGGSSMVILQLTAKSLPGRAALVRIWQYRHEGVLEQSQDVMDDLDQVAAPKATSAVYRLKRYHFHIEIPKTPTAAVANVGEAVYRTSIENRHAPMRTISFMYLSELGDGHVIRFMIYRTFVTVESVNGSPQSEDVARRTV
jgi:hypothetical protein